MSTTDNELCDLGGRIEYARVDLVEAAKLTLRLIGDDPEIHYPGWPAMIALHDRLQEINRLLDDLPGDEIAWAIKTATALDGPDEPSY